VCRRVDFTFATVTTWDAYKLITGWLGAKGDDGSYAYITGADAAGHNPSDNLTQYPIAWDYIFQATHTTTVRALIVRRSSPCACVTGQCGVAASGAHVGGRG
jgi:hypothetical protein